MAWQGPFDWRHRLTCHNDRQAHDDAGANAVQAWLIEQQDVDPWSPQPVKGADFGVAGGQVADRNASFSNTA